jgi:hypothetical protein
MLAFNCQEEAEFAKEIKEVSSKDRERNPQEPKKEWPML